jgi:hypothetical protein
LGELRALADAGDKPAAELLAGLLAERGDYDGAVRLLRPHPWRVRATAMLNNIDAGHSLGTSTSSSASIVLPI